MDIDQGFQEKTAHIQILAINKKIHNFCPILMKLGENDYLIRQLFSPSFMRMGQKWWIFYYWAIFERVRFFLTQTLNAEKAQGSVNLSVVKVGGKKNAGPVPFGVVMLPSLLFD